MCYHFICFIYVCVYTHGAIQTWRRKLLLSLIMLPIRMHGLYVWMRVDSHIHIHPTTPTNSYKHLHMHTHPYTFTTHKYCCTQILLFFYSYLSHNTYYLFVPLYSHVIFKYFIIICNSVLLILWPELWLRAK